MLPNSILLITLLLGTAGGLSTQEGISHGLPSHYQESDITWTGRIKEDGEPVSFTGADLQSIEAQIRATQPDFSWARAVDEPAAAAASSSSRTDADTDMLCQLPWNAPFASVFHIRQGIAYLHKIHDNCIGGPGPGNCSRVSCSYNSAIFFCNDNPYAISVPCSSFGDRAWEIIEKCYAFGDFPTDSVQGQVFDAAGWNVIVAGTIC
ncbi:hypothetical protein ONZ43_g4209 [Nemania bipapillata]|uniref:Uncharacterized protein n=1 Tax=Nemania bipapillata TaxID=110536 RepID=A0ACC2IQD4_9PEZI|nr:hypothetical protein ONZ43_g4209 [Nemania bipapillata]